MRLSQHEDKCGYNMMMNLHISAEWLTKLLNVAGQEQVGWAVWLTSSPKLKVYHGNKPEARH